MAALSAATAAKDQEAGGKQKEEEGRRVEDGVRRAQLLGRDEVEDLVVQTIGRQEVEVDAGLGTLRRLPAQEDRKGMGPGPERYEVEHGVWWNGMAGPALWVQCAPGKLASGPRQLADVRRLRYRW